MANEYSSTWFDVFGRDVATTQTDREVGFVMRHLPLDSFPRVFDLCCGEGRHTIGLARQGYDVTGIDRNAAALESARAKSPAPGARYRLMDVQDVATIGPGYDGGICMWQSFGFLDAAANARLLSDVHAVIRPHGRLILDVYNADFFRDRQGTRTLDRGGRRITENKSLTGDRLRIELVYDDAAITPDVFGWQVYDPRRMTSLLNRGGWSGVLACREFDERLDPSPDHPRMQFVATRALSAFFYRPTTGIVRPRNTIATPPPAPAGS